MNRFIPIVVGIVLLLSCSEATKKPMETAGSEVGTKAEGSYEEKLKSYLRDEIDAKISTSDDLKNPELVFEKYGKDFEVSYLEASGSFLGGQLKNYRYLKNGLTSHIYYVFDDGTQIYGWYTIDKNLPSMKSILIGDDSEKLTEVFGSEFTSFDSFINYQIGDVQLQFYVENKRIGQINVNFILE